MKFREKHKRVPPHSCNLWMLISGSIERRSKKREDLVQFRFSDIEDGREALRLSLAAVAGRCGSFYFLPTTRESGGYNYMGFKIEGDINALACLCVPFFRDHVKRVLDIRNDELDSMFSAYFKNHHWYKRWIPLDSRAERVEA